MRLLQVTLVLSFAHFGCNASTECSDPSRSLGGVVSLSKDESVLALGAGPFLLTDVMTNGYVGDLHGA